MLTTVKDADGFLVAIIMNGAADSGAQWATPAHSEQQVARMKVPMGKVFKAHVHKPVERIVYRTCETLVVVKGRLEARVLDDNGRQVAHLELAAGEALIQLRGGHAYRALTEVELFEVKQGPFAEGEKLYVEDVAFR